ncbi:restriction endonuclease subunit S [Ferrovum sp. PN-J185]|uniref:restriction endonuclease subunit S n=1 Tax=Ferrovum sp. PN-J185 TaxID=1356306 RepID=UPI0007995D09|nr:restriction endonuclease subunit S [Ferrovum sp. PN-J185]KXW55402.1 type I restriction modification DNA specificity domain protein [Ferrovum sp. PN-J185]
MTFNHQMVRLDNIAKINPKRSITKGVEIPFVDMAAVPQHSRNITVDSIEKRIAKAAGSHFQNGDTLLARITPCLENGKTAQVSCLNENVVGEGSTEFIVLCGIDEADNDFIYYLCREPSFREYAISRMEGTSGRQRVSWQSIAEYEFFCPPQNERRQAAQILSTIDNRIQLLQDTNKTLEQLAQALFKSWFVDFDIVHANVSGLLLQGIPEATMKLFPKVFTESKKGLLPEGWKLVPFGELITNTIGGDWGSDVSDEKNNVRVAIIRGTDIPDLQMSTNNRVPIRYTSQKKLATRRLQDGDILIEVSGGSKEQPTGRSLFLSQNLLDRFDCPVEPASFCRLMRPINKNIGVLLAQHLTYIYAIGKTWEYQNQSTGIANFQTSHFLENELVVIPCESVLIAFAEAVEVFVNRIQMMQIETLSSLRDTLLPRLISGQLSVNDVELDSLTA